MGLGGGGNETSQAKSFESFDFATLYTTILHDALKEKVGSLVSEAYRVMGAKYLVVDRHCRAHWSESPSTTHVCISVDRSKLIA